MILASKLIMASLSRFLHRFSKKSISPIKKAAPLRAPIEVPVMAPIGISSSVKANSAPAS